MKTTRRTFLKHSAGAIVLPLILPHTLFGTNAPSNRINIGAIGTGRISRDHDMPGVWKYDNVRIIAASDVDSKRLSEAKQMIEGYYTKKLGKTGDGVKMYEEYRELLQNRDIDAVLISTPDHWHALQAVDAVKAGKHVYCQKPTSLTIAEGRIMSNAVNATGRIFQIGSQQRSMEQFRFACELVRNGRIGELKSIDIRLPGDPSGGDPKPMDVPSQLNYDKWLGSTPEVPYTVDRVHPLDGYGRPGWLRCEQFGAGMITGWGAHHFDIAHWAMDREYSGPVEIWGKATFATGGLWDVHGEYATRMVYDNGVVVTGTTDGPDKPNGVLFTGTEGWIFVCRGNYQASANDPVIGKAQQSLMASDPKLLTPLGSGDLHLPVSTDHHGNWLNAIRTGERNITPAEVAHRSCSACLLQHIAMKLNRTLKWDPLNERFLHDDQANAMLARPMRVPYSL